MVLYEEYLNSLLDRYMKLVRYSGFLEKGTIIDFILHDMIDTLSFNGQIPHSQIEFIEEEIRVDVAEKVNLAFPVFRS